MKTCSSLHRGWALALALLLIGVGCAPEIPQNEDVTRVETVFNPDESRIPLPSDLALDDDGTLPKLPGADDPTAQGDFLRYLDTLHGWLPSTGMSVPVEAEIDEETLTEEAVLLFRLEADGAEQLEVADVSFDADALEIHITPAAPFEFATHYGYVITQQVKDTDGNPLVAAQPLFFATSSAPLVEVDDEGECVAIEHDLLAQGATLEDACALEGMRKLMQPVVDAAIAAGVARSEIASMTSWHTADDAFVVFDPAAGEVPFPNEFVRTGEGGTVALPTPDGADELTTGVIQELNRRDGFSVTARGWLPIQGSALDLSTVTEEHVPLAWVRGASVNLYEEDRYELDFREELGVMTFGPEGLPFEQGRTNAGIVLTDVKDVHGRGVKPTPAFVFLRSQSPVFEDGKSTVEQLDDGIAERLEEARRAYQQLFIAALSLGYTNREEIAVAFAFETDNATEYQQKLNAKAVALATEGGSPAASGEPADAEPAPSDFDELGLIQREASYTTQFFIDASAEGGLADEPTEELVPITIAVPNTNDCGEGPYPAVIVGHGDGGSRADSIEVLADALAASPYCLVTVAPDFLLHGGRPSQGNDASADFLSGNPIATKNNILQTVVDLAVLVEVIKEDGLEDTLDDDSGTDLIDETSIGYAGTSLGALIGSNVLATVPDVTVGALNEPGARLTQILLEGALAEEILPQLPEGLEPGTIDFFRTFSFLQWVVEPSDPWSFAPFVRRSLLDLVSYDVAGDEYTSEEIDDQDADRYVNEVLIQMAGDDQVIPNATTELLADAIGVSLEDTTFPGMGHSFIRGETDEAECARRQIAVWLSSGLSSAPDQKDAALGTAEEAACGLASN